MKTRKAIICLPIEDIDGKKRIQERLVDGAIIKQQWSQGRELLIKVQGDPRCPLVGDGEQIPKFTFDDFFFRPAPMVAVDGKPVTICGKPVVEVNDMPDGGYDVASERDNVDQAVAAARIQRHLRTRPRFFYPSEATRAW